MPIETLPLARMKIVGAAALEAVHFSGQKWSFMNRNGKSVQEVAGGTSILRYHESSGAFPLNPAMKDGLRQGYWLRQRPSEPPEPESAFEAVGLGGCRSVVSLTKKGGVSWCGLFARAILADAGFQATWAGRRLCLPSHQFATIEKGAPGWKDLELKPGDVGIIPGRVHHVILAEEISPGAFEVAEGNMGPPHFVWYRTGTPKSVYRKNDFGLVYKLLE